MSRTMVLAICALLILFAGLPQTTEAQDATDAAPSARDRSNFDRIPTRMLRFQKRSAEKAVSTPGLTWRKPLVTVAFYGGSPETWRLVEDAAKDWIAPGSPIAFSFRRDDGSWRRWSPNDVFPASDIRVGFETGASEGGFWSVIGEQAREVHAWSQTMNLHDFDETLSLFHGRSGDPEWVRSWERGTIVHEFGHALALSHEHFHPDCQRDLDIAAAAARLVESNGWEMEQARYQVDAYAYFTSFGALFNPRFSRKIDQASIMLYPDLALDARSGTSSACAVSLPDGSDVPYAISKGDRDVMATLYPTKL
jgi:hypothetical protein